jgi:putative lipoic acid-binding regulatory protein
MQEIDFTQAKKDGKGFQFPGEFEITAMGNAGADLPVHVPRLLEGAGLHVLHETVRYKQSAAGNYVSVTVSFRAETREQYDTAHTVLRADPDIRYTL